MGEKEYVLTQEQINKIASVAAEKAVEIYKLEVKRNQRNEENQNIRITKKKLAAYRRVKASLSETEEFTEDEKIELRWAFVVDLMGSGLKYVDKAEGRIKAIEHKRKRDTFEVQMIDKAMGLYKREVDKSTNKEAQRRYRELYAMYIDDPALSVKEIAEIENISEKIVYRDLGIAYKILSVYLLGM